MSYDLFYRFGLYRLMWHEAAPSAPFTDWVGPGQGRTALDIGAGAGTLSLWLAAQGWKVTALDASEQGLRILRKRAKTAGVSVQTVRKNIVTDTLDLGGFDLVVDRECFQDLWEDPEREGYARNLERVLGPGGTFIVQAWLRPAGQQPRPPPTVAEGMLEHWFSFLRLDEQRREPLRRGRRNKPGLRATYRFHNQRG
ncbi:class I SAM-dependent methyltransferase [Myxococcaceae bacterium GXIMD 01537]